MLWVVFYEHAAQSRAMRSIARVGVLRGEVAEVQERAPAEAGRIVCVHSAFIFRLCMLLETQNRCSVPDTASLAANSGISTTLPL